MSFGGRGDQPAQERAPVYGVHPRHRRRFVRPIGVGVGGDGGRGYPCWGVLCVGFCDKGMEEGFQGAGREMIFVFFSLKRVFFCFYSARFVVFFTELFSYIPFVLVGFRTGGRAGVPREMPLERSPPAFTCSERHLPSRMRYRGRNNSYPVHSAFTVAIIIATKS